jgi:hypothetical protein
LVTAGQDGMIFLWEGKEGKGGHGGCPPQRGTDRSRTAGTDTGEWEASRDDYWLSDDEDDGEDGDDGGGAERDRRFVPPILLLR